MLLFSIFLLQQFFNYQIYYWHSNFIPKMTLKITLIFKYLHYLSFALMTAALELHELMSTNAHLDHWNAGASNHLYQFCKIL